MDQLMTPPPGSTSPAEHRGSMILTFGILSIVFSCLAPVALALAILAIRWSGADLRRMDRGEMDKEGRSLTSAGRVCAIIGTVTSGFSTLYWAFWIVVLVLGAILGPTTP